MDDFWDDMRYAFSVESALDTVLGGQQLDDPNTVSMRGLTDAGRKAHAVDPNQKAGTRVWFVANLGSVLSYADIPEDKMHGTVVTVKAADGLTTNQDGRLFVLWDDGKFRPILGEHLRLAGKSKRANNVRIIVSDLGDLSAFFTPAASGNQEELVHKATKDLWSFKKDGDQYVIERLFDESGEPLKV